MKNRIAFLFGAGAEIDYGLPQGDVFARKTLLEANNKLYDALAKFYSDIGERESLKGWVSNYHRDTAFSKETGRQIIAKTISLIIRTYGENQNFLRSDLKWAIEEFFTNGNLSEVLNEPIVKQMKDDGWSPLLRNSNRERNELDQVLNYMESPNTIPANHPHIDLLKSITKEMKSYGVLEKYFYTIINPKKYGPVKYWKLINYYWQTFFVILIPLCEYLMNNGDTSFNNIDFEIVKDEIVKNKDNYCKFLTNIEYICQTIWNKKSLTMYKSNHENHYYQYDLVKNAVGVITTNYTPIIHAMGPMKIAHINGNLKIFEYPFELAAFDFGLEQDRPEHKMFFPFIFGTSSLKPIVHSIQTDQFTKLKEILSESNTLVIIGYGLNEDDNHLNSFIREFLFSRHEGNPNRIIYCSYSDRASIDVLQIKKYILSLLRICGGDEHFIENFDQVKIIHNTGDSADLFNKINQSLNENFS